MIDTSAELRSSTSQSTKADPVIVAQLVERPRERACGLLAHERPLGVAAPTRTRARTRTRGLARHPFDGGATPGRRANVVTRHVDGDGDEEGAQRRICFEFANGAGDRGNAPCTEIFGGCRVADQARCERAHRRVVAIVELAERLEIARA